MEEVANPIAKASFDRVEPAVEKMYRRLGFGLRQARRRAIARHGVISAGVPTPESLVGPSWRLRRLQFPTTPATAPRNLRRLESSSHCRFVGIEMLDNDIIAFDLQNIKDLLAGVCFANASTVHLKPA